MHEGQPNNQEIPKAADAQVDIEIDIDPAMYIIGAKEAPATAADDRIMVGENFIKPKTEGRQGHIPLPLGEEIHPISDIYKRMVSDPNDGRPDISI